MPTLARKSSSTSNVVRRDSSLRPPLIVATVRADEDEWWRGKGGDLGTENVAAVQAGCPNLGRHITTTSNDLWAYQVVVAINHVLFRHRCRGSSGQSVCRRTGSICVPVSKHWDLQGSAGDRGVSRIMS